MLSIKSLVATLGITIGICLSGLPVYAETLVVTTASDDPDPKYLTLREAIAQAASGDIICFDPKLAGQAILLNTGRRSLVTDKNLTITAAGLPGGITVDGNRSSGGNFSVFLHVFGLLSLENLTITGSGSGPGVIGGGINCSRGANLAVTNCVVTNNQAQRHGGISAWGSFTMTRTTVSNNTAQAGVGGVDADGNGNSPVNITDSTITGNRGLDGGFDANFGAQGTISNTVISNNNAIFPASGTGGGFFFTADLTFENCQITENTGGGLRAHQNSNITLRECQISNNSTFGVDVRDSRIAMTNCQISGNGNQPALRITNQPAPIVIADTTIDDNAGLGLDHSGSNITLNNCNITNNRSGGIRNVGTMRLDQCTITGNSSSLATLPGGILSTGSNLTIESSTIADNSALAGGGITTQAVVIGESTLILNYCTLSGNRATNGNGGGIRAVNTARSVSVILNNCTISGNTANNGKGGGIYLDSGNMPSTLNLRASTITQNSALGSGANGRGGGIFVEIRPTAIVQSNNTILAGNTDAFNFAPDAFAANVNSQGYNLVGIIDGSDGWVGAGDQTGDISSPLDPVLGKLADNGGPTKTHALLKGSPAIDTGNPALAGTRDQRGVTRGKVPDIGSYELK